MTAKILELIIIFVGGLSIIALEHAHPSSSEGVALFLWAAFVSIYARLYRKR